MLCHACLKCRQVLYFSTQPDGTRDAVCCAMRYISDPRVSGLIHVSAFHDDDGPQPALGSISIDEPDYDGARGSILDEGRRLRDVPRDLI